MREKVKAVRRACIWYGLLNKRLLKKYVFTFLLILTPFLVLGFRLVSRGDSGILHVLLCAEEGAGDSSATAEVISDLLEKDSILFYEEAEDEEAAREQVRTGGADCLWVFPSDLSAAVSSYVSGESRNLVTVYLREDTVFTRLAREQLTGELYPRLSLELAVQFTESDAVFGGLPEGEVREEIGALYEENRVTDDLIRLSYLNGVTLPEEGNYLTAPLRGLLALLVLLCALACALFCEQDRENQIFTWMPVRHRRLFPWLYILIGTSDAGIVALAGLALSGTFTGWARELGLMVLYVLAAAGFCSLLRGILRNIRLLGACIPILILLSLVLCPVLFSVRNFPVVQYLLPTYYYLNSLYSSTMTVRMVLYTAAADILGIAVSRL